ncbi:DUF2273 domain-containing protein [Gleimia hominis]|uniref:DUF2273 domain-containing protein n=1 Tax=Gleimia hominis TaxID=595468 RepID=A0ABU3I9V3_9ACTO|nr:DUF2273 domain-containing protein [Gleimia hominis]MDT3766716.1 DUF2273 domain-containing protein [Gleimia hominis]WIK64118.1 DUF2273 domain-containing protein [Gleimia hominis]
MNHTQAGMFAGAILAVVAVVLGFWPFLLTVVFMAVGGLLGKVLAGDIDVRDLTDSLAGNRSTTSD